MSGRRRSLERTAFHEAGHAVVAVLLGRSVEVSIIPTRSSHGDCTASGMERLSGTKVTHSLRSLWRNQHNMIILLAGMAAQDRLEPHRMPIEAEQDFEMAMLAALPHAGRSKARRAAFLQTPRRIACDGIRNHWRAVRAVANALLRERKLVDQEVREIIRRAESRRSPQIGGSHDRTRHRPGHESARGSRP